MLDVWSRDEVTRIDFEDFGSIRPCKVDRLEGRFPFQRFEVLGEIIG